MTNANIAEAIANLTRAEGRKSLYHFTRAANLPAMARFDALWSSYRITPEHAGERRLAAKEVDHDGYALTVNSHLRIPEGMMAPGCSVERFRACLDKHVFFWPTRRDCLKMLETYKRREPDERFAVLELDAARLLAANGTAVKLSKYDSGSSPRFPQNCTYRKSPEMFVPLAEFGRAVDHAAPVKASEVKEVLVEDRVDQASRFLKAVYVDGAFDIAREWRRFAAAMDAFIPVGP